MIYTFTPNYKYPFQYSFAKELMEKCDKVWLYPMYIQNIENWLREKCIHKNKYTWKWSRQKVDCLQPAYNIPIYIRFQSEGDLMAFLLAGGVDLRS